jgi:hypothetical protein
MRSTSTAIQRRTCHCSSLLTQFSFKFGAVAYAMSVSIVAAIKHSRRATPAGIRRQRHTGRTCSPRQTTHSKIAVGDAGIRTPDLLLPNQRNPIVPRSQKSAEVPSTCNNIRQTPPEEA